MQSKIILLLTQHINGLQPSHIFRFLELHSSEESDEMRKTLSEMESAAIIQKIFIGCNIYIWRLTA
jgi:hypothetical protein